MYKTVVKSVSEIITVLEEISCVTVARTLKFNLGNDGWNYLVCNVCTKRTHEVGSFKCLSCDAFNDYPRIRYKLKIQVTDGKKVAKFMLWDQDCMNLICVSVADLRKKMIKASQVSECMVSGSSDIVPDICNSSAMVIGKCINASVCDLPTSSGTSLMCLSSTANDEPDIVLCMTPTKDVCASIDDVQDIPSSIMEFDFLEDIPLAQLSATKTTKSINNIKKEKL
ncbi:uncharacterized protein LOC114180570 isoform X2 [Vigna unguiculata]|nr:uncharacterized protein LOC114180570 isoform X2 [Vigna unguiculata]